MANERMKMAVIAGAAEALKQKSENPKKTDGEIIKDISKKAAKMAEKIDVEESY